MALRSAPRGAAAARRAASSSSSGSPRPRCACCGAGRARRRPATRPSTPTAAPCARRTRAAIATASAPLAKPAGVRRVLSLGDSFAWGASVEFEDAYPQRLERGLTRRRARALGGREPGPARHEHRRPGGAARGRGLGLRARRGAARLRAERQRGRQAAETRRAEDWVRSPPGRPRGLLDRSALFRLVARAPVGHRREPAAHRRLPLDVRRRRAGLDREPRGAEADGRALPRARRAVRGRRSSRCSATRSTTAIRSRRSTRRWREAAAAAGARVVDLLPAYRGLRWDLLVVDGVDDEHPNEIAHRIAAGVDAARPRRRRAAAAARRPPTGTTRPCPRAMSRPG